MSANKSEIPKLFGTSGIRGVVGAELTHEMLLNVGKSIAAGLKPSGCDRFQSQP